ncbi:MAG: ABC transporter permease [Roseiflexaceae bacterium]|nr:ABC transporter permease [Roseiflexaceae bacterium]
MREVLIVVRKELIDAFRDRKGMAAALFYPLLGPILLLALFAVIGQTVGAETDQRLELAVGGANNGPALVEFLRQNEVDLTTAPTESRAAVLAGDLPVVLEIGPGFQAALDAGQPAPISLIADTSRQTGSITVDRVRELLDQFSAQTAATRLRTQGLDPALIVPLTIAEVDVATEQSRAAAFLNLAPYFIIFALFLGGAGIAIDTTVGERDRRSLEPLLLTGVPRSRLVLGKMLAALALTLLIVIETLLAFALVINLIPVIGTLDVPVSFPPMAIMLVFLIIAPIILLAVALQMIIATVSSNFKEAQSYLMFLPLIPALPGMFLAFLPVKPALWNMLIPTFGQQLLINQVVRGEQPNLAHALISAGVTLLTGLALTLLVLRLYQREQILFKPASG